MKEYFSDKDRTSPMYINVASTINAPNETKSSILSVFKQKIKLFSSKENLSEIRFERSNNKISLSIKPMEFEEIKINEIENISEIFIKSLSIAKNTIEQLNKIL